jgi:hypothetical protein
MNLGKVAFLRKQFVQAELEYNKSFQIADSLKNRHLLIDIYHNYYQLFYATNDSRRALEYYQNYVSLKDTTALEQSQIQPVLSKSISSGEENLFVSLIIIQFLIIVALIILVIWLKKQRDVAQDLLQEYNIPVKN